MIQGVEKVRTDFQAHALADRHGKALCKTEVHIPQTRLADRTTANVTGPDGRTGRTRNRNQPENRWI